MPAKKKTTKTLRDQLLEYALTLPEAWEDHPWGESVAKIRKKVFVFFGVDAPPKGVFFCVKLPESATYVLTEPWAEPAGYGLGKADWVYLNFEKKPAVALSEMKEWIDESYCAVAPKTLARRVRPPD